MNEQLIKAVEDSFLDSDRWQLVSSGLYDLTYKDSVTEAHANMMRDSNFLRIDGVDFSRSIHKFKRMLTKKDVVKKQMLETELALKFLKGN
jgi:hypothetical protein